MKQKDNSLLVHEIICAILPLSNMIFTSFWGLLLIGIFSSFELSEGSPLLYISLLPLLVSPVFSIIGVAKGIKNLKNIPYATVCLILSIIGIIFYMGMMLTAQYIGSIY